MSNKGIQLIQALGIAAIAAMAGADPALALTTLKQVQVSNGSQIDLLFDGKISKGQLKTEYFNDIIQISMTDVAVYPAKISSINGGDLTKVFAYQYAPRLVRCRISVRGKAEEYKDRFKIVTTAPGGKVITLALEGAKNPASDSISVAAAAPEKPAHAEAVARVAEGAPGKASDKKLEAEEKALLERVMSGTAPMAAAEKPASNERKGEKEAERAEKSEKSEKGEKGEKSARSEKDRKEEGKIKAQGQGSGLGSARPLPSFTGLFVKLGGVLALFGLIALAFRRIMNLKQHGAIEAAVSGGKPARGVAGVLSRFARSGLGRISGIGAKPRMIEVLSTQHLGPKNSIAVVRVMEQVLVLGITADAINLITQVGEGEAGAGLESLEDLEELGVLSKHAVKGTASKTSAAASLAAAQSVTRSTPQRGGLGATAAGPAVFADLLRNEATKPRIGAAAPGPSISSPAPLGTVNSPSAQSVVGPKVSRPLSPASRDYLNAGQNSGPSLGGFAGAPGPQGQATSANVRAQIKSRIEGMKQL